MRPPLLALCGVVLVLALAPRLRSADPPPRDDRRAPDPNRTRPGPYRPLPLRIRKVDEKSITVYPRTDDPQDLTFVIDPEQTKVFVHVVTEEFQNDKGQTVRRTVIEPGSIDDLEVGRDVYIGASDDVAVDIVVPPKPPAREKSKEKKRDEKK